VKSIGHEETFAHDRHTHDELWREAVRLADAVSARLRASGLGGARTVSVKLRFSDFVTLTRSHTLPAPVATATAILGAVGPMLRRIELDRGVRLLGISVSGFGAPAEQLSLDDALAAAAGPSAQEWEAASETIDAIRGRFGSASIGPASALTGEGMRLGRPGAQQWGPDRPADDRREPRSSPAADPDTTD
jgi:DNA polymerase-4